MNPALLLSAFLVVGADPTAAPRPAQGSREIWNACVNPTDGMSGEFIIKMCDVVFMQPSQYPGEPGLIYIGFGEGWMRRGDFDRALTNFLRATSAPLAKSDQARAHRGAARAYFRLGNYHMAADFYSVGDAIESGDVADLLEFAQACRMSKNTECALKQWARVYQIDPSSVPTEYADMLVSTGDDELRFKHYEEAASAYRKAADASSVWRSDAGLHVRLARALRRAGRIEEARRAIDPFAGSADSAAVRMELAIISFEEKRFGAGADEAEAGLKVSPGDARLLYLRGVGKQLEYAREVSIGMSTPHTELWDAGAEDIERAKEIDRGAVSTLGADEGVLPPASKPTPITSSATALPASDGAPAPSTPFAPTWLLAVVAVLVGAAIGWRLKGRAQS